MNYTDMKLNTNPSKISRKSSNELEKYSQKRLKNSSERVMALGDIRENEDDTEIQRV